VNENVLGYQYQPSYAFATAQSLRRYRANHHQSTINIYCYYDLSCTMRVPPSPLCICACYTRKISTVWVELDHRSTALSRPEGRCSGGAASMDAAKARAPPPAVVDDDEDWSDDLWIWSTRRRV